MRNLYIYILLTAILPAILPGCKKFVQIDSSGDRLLRDQVFDNEGTANSAIAGIYRMYRDQLQTPLDVLNSLSSDETRVYFTNAAYADYYRNQLRPNEASLPWAPLYRMIYAANSAIEGLQGSLLQEGPKSLYLAEAKFTRAFGYLYLVNLFGPVPLITNTDISVSSTMSRTDTAAIYKQIITDLTEAQQKLRTDYHAGTGRVRANKWAAAALLARTYLYVKDWAKAEEQANSVIQNGGYELLDSGGPVFGSNNKEAILQLDNTPTDINIPATFYIFTTAPSQVCTNSLIQAFEPGDKRKEKWLKAQLYSATGETLYYPYKFTSIQPGVQELCTVLRLGEQYLIRAEARAMKGDLAGAISDINLLRARHGGLSAPLPVPVNREECLGIILRERFIDLFTEGCHRWFDLKRTGRLDAVMKTEKPATWRNSAALYPIPLDDIQRNQQLTQNPGYN